MPRPLGSERTEELTQAERDIRARIGDRDLDFASMAAVSNIFRSANAVRNRIEREVLGPRDLTWGGFTILFVLWIWGDQETGELARETGVAKGTLTGMIHTLRHRGLVDRIRHQTDGRKAIVRLTDLGLRTVEEVFPEFHASEVMATRQLTEEEQRELAGYLRRITRSALSA